MVATTGKNRRWNYSNSDFLGQQFKNLLSWSSLQDIGLNIENIWHLGARKQGHC